jgi:cytochrome c biogenesis protein CcdA/glutaredoxin
MKKIITFTIITLILALPMIGYAQASDDSDTAKDVDLVFFYGQGCPHCAKARLFFDEIKPDYPTLNIIEYEVYGNRQNNKLFQEMAAAFDTKISGVPTTFIDERVLVGFSASLGKTMEKEIQRCVKTGCSSPLDRLKNGDSEDIIQIIGDSSPSKDPEKEELTQQLTIPAVISAAAVDAINPCAFAVLIILLTTVLASKNRKRALWAGMAFTLSIYISYLLMGVGLYSAIQAASFTRIFYIVVAVLAIFVGLFNLKDYFWYGKWFVMEVPMSWRPKLQALIRGVTSIPGAFLIGFAVSLFLLPCTSGPYIVILGLLAHATEWNYAMALLLLYNFIFVLPMIIITGAIYYGFTTTEQAEEWRKGKLKILHLIAGIIILLLGIGMLTAIALGYM